MKRLFLTLCCAAAFVGASAQEEQRPSSLGDAVGCRGMHTEERRTILVPDIEGYHTLKCDLHEHTSRSDAQVLPAGRVREAWADGLDAIAITDHIGYHPEYEAGVPDYNAVYRQAQRYAEAYGILLIKGVEISRDLPFGHMNALFLEDCNVFCEDVYRKDSNGKHILNEHGGWIYDPQKELEDLEAAERQGAFLQWNHPGRWGGKCVLDDFHRRLMEEGRLHAIELFNKDQWYPTVLEWADKYPDLRLAANTDLHHPTSYIYGNCLRPMNLVFARERTLESLREAMFAGRMVAFFDNKLAGRAEWLAPLVRESLAVRVLDAKRGRIEVTNRSDIEFRLRRAASNNETVILPRRAVIITLPAGEKVTFTNVFAGNSLFETVLWQ